MKKLKAKRKRYLAARDRSQRKANARSKLSRSERNSKKLRKRRRKPFRKTGNVKSPEVFSLTQNPNGTIRFFRQIRELARTQNVFVDLSDVKVITPDAIAGLLATIHHWRIGKAKVSGNMPNDGHAENILQHSGFKDYVFSRSSYQLSVPMGTIKKRHRSQDAFNARFDQFLAKDLIEFATKKLRGVAAPHRPSFSIFCEAMLNTFNHASTRIERHEPWWASVYYDDQRKRACFTFIDQGVGIFESHRLTVQLQLLEMLRILSHAQILERLFHGKIPSGTGIAGRGNGIPGMFDHCKAGRVEDLTLLANDAIGYAATERYEGLTESYDGTILYWEIRS